MGLKIVDLLKYKTPLTLLDPKGNPILHEDKPVVVYLRIIGDDDLEKAHTAARLASASIRKTLQDKESEVYRDRVAPIAEANREEAISLIMQYKTANLDAEARANVTREELPEIEEFAVEPDAPTLEEMEKLDAAIEKQDKDYQKALEDYIQARTDVMRAELEELSLQELRDLACDNIAGIVALAEFFTVLMAEKLVRGTYTDKAYTQKAFDSVEEFLATDSGIKDQLIETYNTLEYNPDSIKK